MSTTNYFKLTFLAGITAFAVSCIENTPQDPGPEPVVPPVTLDLYSSLSSKTVLGEEVSTGNWSVYWTDGDRVCVNGVKSSTLFDIPAKTSNADFTVSGVSAPYYIVYPSIICSGMNSDGVASIELPSAQAYKEGTFATAGSAVLYACTSENSTELKNICGIVKLPVVKGSEYGKVINRIALCSSSGNAPLSGSFTLDTKTGEMKAVEGGSTVFVSLPAEGVELDESEETDFYLSVPSGEYPDGFSLVLTGPEGTMISSWTEDTEIVAGKIMLAETVAFKPKSTKYIDGIDTWNEFAQAVNDNDYERWLDPDTGEATIVADISYGGDLTLISTLPDGMVLNGNGHTIKRAQATEPLISLVSAGATVKNLTVGGVRVSPSATSDRGTGNLAAFNRGLIENCVNDMAVNITSWNDNLFFAGLVTDNAGVIKDSKNLADISISLSITSNRTVYGGGISARGWRNLNSNADKFNGDFINCENKGSIIVNRTSSGNYSLTKFTIGGICGSIEQGESAGEFCLFEGCKNSGNITYWQDDKHTSNNYGYSAGGIVGRCCKINQSTDFYYLVGGATNTAHEGYYVKLDNCTNTGSIDISLYTATMSPAQSGARQCYIGGLIGSMQSQYDDWAEIKNCTVNCEIRSGHLSVNEMVGGLCGCFGYANASGCNVDVRVSPSKTTMLAPKYMGVAGASFGFTSRDCTLADSDFVIKYEKGNLGANDAGFVGYAGKNANIAQHVEVPGYAILTLNGTNTFAGTINNKVVTVDNVMAPKSEGRIIGSITIK